MASQDSVRSTASTIPQELIDGQDDSFINELDEVDQLFFGNVENPVSETLAIAHDVNDDDEEKDIHDNIHVDDDDDDGMKIV